MRIPRQLLLSLLLINLFSCSINDMEQNPTQEKIDLALVDENEWGISNAILEAINTHRENIGINVLLKDTSYATAYAVKHSKYMEATESTNHNNFFIRSAALKEKGAKEVSENIAYGYSTAVTVVDAWLKSDAHRQIVEGHFSHIGFGVIKSSDNRYYYTTLYYRK